MHILSPETDNCPSWISGRERMTVENISWSISTKECCRPRRGLNPRPPGLQSDGASNWATEAGNKHYVLRIYPYFLFPNDNLSKYQWIFTKFGLNIDIVKIWFGNFNRQISLFFDRFICKQYVRIFISGRYR